jgi:hypothetical protein
MSLIDLASLVLAPTATKEGKVYSAIPDTGEGDMTFTRGSAATRVNSAGLIEKERANLLLQSNSFDTTWVSIDVSLTSGQTGYDGSSDAWRLTKNASSLSRIQQNQSISGIKTVSVYAKAETSDSLRFRLGSNDYIVEFNLSDETSTNVGSVTAISHDVQSIGSGWYRCIATWNVSSASVVQIDNEFGTTSSNTILIQDAMLNQGLVAQSYIPTTTTAVYEGITDDVPRVDYSGGGCPSLLLEGQRTNVIAHSEYLEGGFSLASNATILIENVTTPDGGNVVTKCQANLGSDNGRVQDNIQIQGNNFVVSGFFKGTGVATRLRFRNNQGSAVLYDIDTSGNFTLVSESAANDNYGIEDFGNGWYRIYFETATSGSTDNYVQIYPDFLDGDGSVYAWGIQAEEGSYVSSYINSYGTSTTRVQDSCSKTGISELIGQTEGTLFLDVDSTNFEGDQRFGISDGTSANRIVLRLSGSIIQFSVVSASTIQASISGSGSSGNRYKMAGVYKENDFALYVNGSLIGTDTSGTISGTFSRIANDNGVGGQNFYNPIKQAILFPTRLTNDQLEELTK